MDNRDGKRIIVALDAPDADGALALAARLDPRLCRVKVGKELFVAAGPSVVEKLHGRGFEIFLDLKFHDIPNSVALGVREAAKHGVWMTTMHVTGGPAMLTAAVMEANEFSADHAPLLIGVSVLTSLDERTLQGRLGVTRSLDEHMIELSKLGVECGLDGVVCSVHEVAEVRSVVDHAIIVTPGIRPTNYDSHDQMRVGGAIPALEAGSDYLVIGRVLTESQDPQVALHDLGLLVDEVAS